jgi:hypothetical protein
MYVCFKVREQNKEDATSRRRLAEAVKGLFQRSRAEQGRRDKQKKACRSRTRLVSTFESRTRKTRQAEEGLQKQNKNNGHNFVPEMPPFKV